MLGDVLLVNNKMFLSMYEAKKKKKTLNELTIEYEKIHACPNGYILRRNKLKDASSYPTCGISRWEVYKTRVRLQRCYGTSRPSLV